MRSGAHEGLMCPLEKGVRGIETGHQMPGRSWQAGKAFAAMARVAARSPREDQALLLRRRLPLVRGRQVLTGATLLTATCSATYK